MNSVEIFKPGIAELREMATKFEGLTINGIDDAEGYKAVKAARKELGDMRILITKTGKAAREEARRYANSVIEQEKQYLGVITPTEDALKAKIEAVDAEKARNERMILLPARKTMLSEIQVEMTDEEILNLDEKQFSEMYTSKKMAYLEEQTRKAQEIERQKQHEEEVKRASEEAAKRATEEAERKAKEEIERVEREKQAEIDRLNREEEDRKKAEADKIAAEQADLERAEKNRRYKAWLKKNNIDGDYDDTYLKVVRNGDNFELWRKVDEITIK